MVASPATVERNEHCTPNVSSSSSHATDRGLVEVVVLLVLVLLGVVLVVFATKNNANVWLGRRIVARVVVEPPTADFGCACAWSGIVIGGNLIRYYYYY